MRYPDASSGAAGAGTRTGAVVVARGRLMKKKGGGSSKLHVDESMSRWTVWRIR